MNIKELKIAVAMLDEFSEILANRGCNDWNFPDDWTVVEKKKFARGYHEWNGDLEEYDENDDNPCMADFAIAGYLASKMIEMSEG